MLCTIYLSKPRNARSNKSCDMTIKCYAWCSKTNFGACTLGKLCTVTVSYDVLAQKSFPLALQRSSGTFLLEFPGKFSNGKSLAGKWLTQSNKKIPGQDYFFPWKSIATQYTTNSKTLMIPRERIHTRLSLKLTVLKLQKSKRLLMGINELLPLTWS